MSGKPNRFVNADGSMVALTAVTIGVVVYVTGTTIFWGPKTVTSLVAVTLAIGLFAFARVEYHFLKRATAQAEANRWLLLRALQSRMESANGLAALACLPVNDGKGLVMSSHLQRITAVRAFVWDAAAASLTKDEMNQICSMGSGSGAMDPLVLGDVVDEITREDAWPKGSEPWREILMTIARKKSAWPGGQIVRFEENKAGR